MNAPTVVKIWEEGTHWGANYGDPTYLRTRYELMSDGTYRQTDVTPPPPDMRPSLVVRIAKVEKWIEEEPDNMVYRHSLELAKADLAALNATTNAERAMYQNRVADLLANGLNALGVK